MNPLLFIAGAAAIGWICDKLTDNEIEKQNRMLRRHREYARRRHAEVDEWERNQYRGIAYDEEQRAEMFRRHQEELARKRRAEFNDYLSEAVDRRKEKFEQISSIKDAVASCKKFLNSNEGGMLRRNELQKLMNVMEKGKAKYLAYCSYLGAYIALMKNERDNGEGEAVPFSFLLPKPHPYVGKVLYFDKKQLHKNSLYVDKTVGDVNILVSDIDQLAKLPEDKLYPLFCDDYDGAPNFVYHLSLMKGIFSEQVLSNPKVGCEATVVSYGDKGEIKLSYMDSISLRMYRSTLKDSKLPPLGSVLQVYPTKWDNAMYWSVVVSARAEDAYVSYQFDEIPVLVTKADEQTIIDYLEKNNLYSVSGDWLIGPVTEDMLPNFDKLKLQLNNDLVMEADVVKRDGRNCLKFSKLLDSESFMKGEDIYFTVDCSMYLGLEEDYADMIKDSPEVLDHMDSLVLTALDEFRQQKQVKLSKRGLQYFVKWAELTGNNINYIECGRDARTPKCILDVTNVTDSEADFGSQITLTFSVDKPNQLVKFIEKSKDDRFSNEDEKISDFAVAISDTDYVVPTIDGDCSRIMLRGDKDKLLAFAESRGKITLYSRQFCVPEKRQLRALQNFRNGRLVNHKFCNYALDGRNIVSERDDTSDLHFFNQGISGDKYQAEAVKNAFAEKNIYFIQGPPGTGKTTVIKELIMQARKANPNALILVTSQANVAVDNVLQRLEREHIPFVRCGNKDKIDEELFGSSFDVNYKEYLSKIREKVQKEPENEILQEWFQVMNLASDKYNSDIGELLFKSSTIIGATCVGLAQRGIGLDRIKFDLVIIDEAGKALPAEMLIPYIQAKKAVIIGDHKQLPPVLDMPMDINDKNDDKKALSYNDDLLDKCLFARMYDAAPDTNKCMLGIQYRMPDVVGSLISQKFYDGKLENGEETAERDTYIFDKNITFIDFGKTVSHEESNQGLSVINNYEALFVANLLQRVRGNISEDKRIAVITPYRGQKREIINQLKRLKYDLLKNRTAVDTVDAFQGDEAEIVIYCTTRTKYPTKYFSDNRRVNVALSRTKNELIIIGSLDYFQKFDEAKSALPFIADYVQKNGKVITLPNSSSKLQLDGQVRSWLVYVDQFFVNRGGE